MGYDGWEQVEEFVEELEVGFEAPAEAPYEAPEEYGHQGEEHHHEHHHHEHHEHHRHHHEESETVSWDTEIVDFSAVQFEPDLGGVLPDLQLAPAATAAATSPPDLDAPAASADTDAAAPAAGPRITIAGDLRVTPSGAGIEVYFTLRNDGADLPEASGLQTYLQVVGDDGGTLVDRRVGMGQALAAGATHFGGDRLDVRPQHCTVFVYTNYKDDGSYDDLKSADYSPA